MLLSRLAEFLLPGELLQLGLFGRHVGLQQDDLRLQGSALAFALLSLLRDLVALLQLRDFFVGLLRQPGGAGEHAGGTEIDVLQRNTLVGQAWCDQARRGRG